MLPKAKDEAGNRAIAGSSLSLSIVSSILLKSQEQCLSIQADQVASNFGMMFNILAVVFSLAIVCCILGTICAKELESEKQALAMVHLIPIRLCLNEN